MALVPEDGTGVNGANTWVSRSEFTTYLSDRASTLSPTDAEKDAALLYACEDIVGRYGDRFIGERASLRVDRLPWPRRDAYDREDRNFSGVIPAILKMAQAEMAIAHLTAELNKPLGQAVTSESVGPVSVSYMALSPTEAERVFSWVDRLLAPILCDRGGAVQRMRRS